MILEIEPLRSFVVLAEELHYRKAAEKLFLSQPALSKQIQRLEQQLGGPLFLRTRRKVLLTEAGETLRTIAKRLLEDADAAFEQTREVLEGRAGTLRIGFGIAAIAGGLPATLSLFQRKHPRVVLRMHDMSTPAQISSLLNGSLDLGIVRLPVAHPEITSRFLFQEQLKLVIPQDVVFRSGEGLASMRDEPFLFLERSTSQTFHDHALAVCRKAGFAPKIVQEASELYTILNLVRAGLGAALVPSAIEHMHVPGVSFHSLDIPEASWQIGMAWNRNTQKQNLISLFEELLSDNINKS